LAAKLVYFSYDYPMDLKTNFGSKVSYLESEIMKPELKMTSDGSHTLYVSELNEPYHSLNGAITESKHVFVANGFLQNTNNPRTVLEVGFGTGLNCLLTAIEAGKHQIRVNYIGIELYPLDDNFAKQLNYAAQIGDGADTLFEAIWSAPWNQPISINPIFNLLKLKTDFLTDQLPQLPGIDVVYFDAFGPEIQPPMWQPGIFRKIYDGCNKGAIFTTYSAKGQVRRDLAMVGFQMKRMPGPPGKKEMLNGIKEG
jgi:tRNA U34 5-methylaminomethyl-2-thiouridine-forming methyltransferase MnmC